MTTNNQMYYDVEDQRNRAWEKIQEQRKLLEKGEARHKDQCDLIKRLEEERGQLREENEQAWERVNQLEAENQSAWNDVATFEQDGREQKALVDSQKKQIATLEFEAKRLNSALLGAVEDVATFKKYGLEQKALVDSQKKQIVSLITQLGSALEETDRNSSGLPRRESPFVVIGGREQEQPTETFDLAAIQARLVDLENWKAATDVALANHGELIRLRGQDIEQLKDVFEESGGFDPNDDFGYPNDGFGFR